MRRNKILTGLMVLALAVVVAAVVAAVADQRRKEQAPPGPSQPSSVNGGEPAPHETPPGPDGTASGPGETDEPDDSAAPTIAPLPVNGQDIADLRQLMMWKFRFDIEQGQYNQYLWVERWTRDAEEPEVRQLGRDVHQVLSEGAFVIKLPTESDPRLFIRLGDATYRDEEAEPVLPPVPWRMSILPDEQDIELGRDIHLITFTHNELTTASGGLSGVHRNHDVTVYVKTRFVPGPYAPFETPGADEQGQEQEPTPTQTPNLPSPLPPTP